MPKINACRHKLLLISFSIVANKAQSILKTLSTYTELQRVVIICGAAL